MVSKTSGDTRRLTTEVGNYAAALLPPGLYRVSIAASGFKEVLFENVPVAITETTVINAELAVGRPAGETFFFVSYQGTREHRRTPA